MKPLGLVVLLILASAVPAVSAQAIDGPPITAETPLYAHGKGDGATLWMNTVKADPDGTDVTETLAFPGDPATPASFKLVPPLSSPLTLDQAGKVVFNIRVGSGILVNVGQVSTSLKAGSTVIAEGTGPANDPTVATYKSVTIEAAPKVAAITPDMGDLVWTISFSGQGAAFIQVGQSGQYCNLVLPVVAGDTPGPEPVPTNETGGDGNETGAPSNSTNSPSPTSSGPSPSESGTASPTDDSAASASSNASKAAEDALKTLDEAGKGIPGPSLFLGLAAVAGAIFLGRRRRA